MSRRALGIALIVAGGLLAVIGLVGMLGGGEPEEVAAPTTSTAIAPSSTTTEPQTNTIVTSTSTTTTPAAATTTLAPTTTTSAEEVEAALALFVAAFAQAVEEDDTTFLTSTLHPAVIAEYGADECQAFIQDEIVLLSDYRLTGEITGPNTASIGGTTVQVYSGPIAFTFQGQEFEAVATLAVEADGPKWFGQCVDSG